MANQTNPLELARQHSGMMSNGGVSSMFFYFRLILVPGDMIDKVTGMVHVLRAPGDAGKNVTFNVTGTYYQVGGFLLIRGEYLDHCDPPADCVYLKKFEAHMKIDQNWKGTGGFTFGNTTVNNCTVTTVPVPVS